MLREGVKWKKTWKKNLGGPLVPPNGNLHGGLMLQIAQKSIYMDKKLTPEVNLPHVGSNRVKAFYTLYRCLCGIFIMDKLDIALFGFNL